MSKAKVKEYSDKEIEELDGYLQYKFNHDIYNTLTNKKDSGFQRFEPLEFFRVFYLAVEQIEQNKAKPLSVARLLQKELCLYGKQRLTDEQRYFFYDKLLELFEGVRYDEDRQLKICRREIEKLQGNLDDEPEETPKREDVFAKVLKHLETLPSERDRIAYLIQEKTKDEQKDARFDLKWNGEVSFVKKCELEINKRKELMMLEESQAASKDASRKHKVLSRDCATLLLDYLFNEAKAKCHNTKKAEVISSLTGYSPNTIEQSFSRFEREKLQIEDSGEVSEKFYNDLSVVRKYAEMLGLVSLVDKIDKDLGENAEGL